jgi:hypothetical protein
VVVAEVTTTMRTLMVIITAKGIITTIAIITDTITIITIMEVEEDNSNNSNSM